MQMESFEDVRSYGECMEHEQDYGELHARRTLPKDHFLLQPTAKYNAGERLARN